MRPRSPPASLFAFLRPPGVRQFGLAFLSFLRLPVFLTSVGRVAVLPGFLVFSGR